MNNDQDSFDGSESASEFLEKGMLALMGQAVYASTPSILRPTFAPRFEACVVCETDLHQQALHYLVFKYIREGEVVVEMAICSKCLDVLEQVYSPKTQDAIDTLFVESNWCESAAERLKADMGLWPQWLDRCALTGQPRVDCDHYEVIGFCVFDMMHVSFFPYIIGAEGIQSMEAAISKQSQANWDRFLGQHQGLPPEFRQLLHLDSAIT